MRSTRIVLLLVFWLPFVFATYMALTTVEHLEVAHTHDKYVHFLTFGYLTGAFALAYARWTTWLRTAGLMLAYASMIEVLQVLIPGRSCSLLDLMADGIGISTALIGLHVIHKVIARFQQQANTPS